MYISYYHLDRISLLSHHKTHLNRIHHSQYGNHTLLGYHSIRLQRVHSKLLYDIILLTMELVIGNPHTHTHTHHHHQQHQQQARLIMMPAGCPPAPAPAPADLQMSHSHTTPIRQQPPLSLLVGLRPQQQEATAEGG